MLSDPEQGADIGSIGRLLPQACLVEITPSVYQLYVVTTIHMKQPRQTNLDSLDDQQLKNSFGRIQQCIISAKTEEQAEKYNEQMKYCKELIANREQLQINFTSM